MKKSIMLIGLASLVLLAASCSSSPKLTATPTSNSTKPTAASTETPGLVIPPTPSGPTVTAWSRYTPTLPPKNTEVPPTAAPTGSVPQKAIAHISSGQSPALSEISMLSKTDGWAIGKGPNDVNDHLLHTADGGATWADVTPPETIDPKDSGGRKASMTAFDAKSAWVTYRCTSQTPQCASPVVWFTKDGGSTWKSSTALSMSDVDYYNPAQLAFVNASSGFLLVHAGAGMSHDYIVLLATTDGGQTWKRMVDPSKDNISMSCTKTGMAFIDARQGWITGNCQGVVAGLYLYQTADGGVTWKMVTLPDPDGFIGVYKSSDYACGADSLQFSNATTGVVRVNCTKMDTQKTTSWLYFTADAGKTWTPRLAPLLQGSFTFINATNGWFLADKRLMATKDGGKTWAQAAGVSWDGTLEFVDENNGWVVAHLGTSVALVHTSNGGKGWDDLKPKIGQ